MKDNNFPAADRVDSSDKQQSVKLPFHKPPFHKLPFFKKPPFKRALKVALFRAWAAGAVCFFAAWGRSGSLDAGPAFSLNLIFGLIFFMILADILIVNPVIRMASGGHIIPRGGDPGEKKGLPLFLRLPIHIIKVTALMVLIIASYHALNVFCIRIRGLDAASVPVPLEPVLFGILYSLYYLLLDTVINSVKRRLKKCGNM